MDSRVKQRWIDALRSGNYKQGTCALRSNDGYCCLGVLCDIHAEETGNKWQETAPLPDTGKPTRRTYLGCVDLLPDEVVKWAGLSVIETGKVLATGANINISIPYEDFDHEEHEDDEDDEMTDLASINDDGTDFKRIAELIAEQL